MLPPDTIAEIESYWAAHLGCPQERLFAARVVTLPHSAFKGYQGLFLVRRGNSCMVATPAELINLIHTCVHGRPVSEVFGSGLWRELLPDVMERVVGPAIMTYGDASTLRADDDALGTLILGEEDAGALDDLASACGQADWDRSGLRADMPAIMGHWIGGELVAAAGYELWGDRIASVGVATRPDWRGRGLGKAVVGALAAHAIEQGLVVQFRALAINRHALAIARSLGFEEYAQTLAVGLNVQRILDGIENDRLEREAAARPGEDSMDDAGLDEATDDAPGNVLSDDDDAPDFFGGGLGGPAEPRD